MFHVEQNVPEVYVQQSRDFQLFSRLYDLVFQSARFSIDSIEQISDTMHCNDNLLPLIATKVGFFTDLNLATYADRQLLSAFPYIIRYKGSLMGVNLVANLFGRIMNTTVGVEHDLTDKHHVTILFESYTPDVTLLYALLEYIRPTGVIIDYVVNTNVPGSTTQISVDSPVKIHTMKEVSINAGEESAVIPLGVADSGKNTFVASNIGFTQVADMTKINKGVTNSEK